MVGIFIKQNNETTDYAAQELIRYLNLMSGKKASAKVSIDEEESIALGLFDNFNLPCNVEDPNFDDAVYVNVKDSKGIIAGSNPRSILFGVYRFLEACGCRWLRHGKDGSFVPNRSVEDLCARIDDKASFRYRGFCIEGAVSYENMLDNVEWAAKLGFNSYFLEFMVPYIFFDRYYSHRLNPYKSSEKRTVDEVKAYCMQIEKEIKKRGLLYHSVGHGWTCEVIGAEGLGWDSENVEIDDETRLLLAEINGERKIYKDVPLNTNLCYGSPEVRRRIVDSIVKHAKKNPHVDMLHFWLADDYNNHCECELCKTAMPSDFFVMMLNELDEELTRFNLKTKIVFLNYQELLWPPVKERIINENRFAMLFAPISRTYSSSYDNDTQELEIPPYVRNKVVLPKGIKENIVFLKGWKKIFQGDCFAYEYHFMWDCYFDPGFYEMAMGLSRDIKNLKNIGLKGIIEDQSQRNFFPTGFPMYLYGKNMWNENADAGKLAEEYFNASFGADGAACRAFMKTVSELFDPVYIRGDKNKIVDNENFLSAMFSGEASAFDNEAAGKLARIPALVEDFRPVIERNLLLPDDSLAKSWEYLRLYAGMLTPLANAFRARAEGNNALARKYWFEVKQFVQINEDKVQSVFDIFEFIEVLRKRFEN